MIRTLSGCRSELGKAKKKIRMYQDAIKAIKYRAIPRLQGVQMDGRSALEGNEESLCDPFANLKDAISEIMRLP